MLIEVSRVLLTLFRRSSCDALPRRGCENADLERESEKSQVASGRNGEDSEEEVGGMQGDEGGRARAERDAIARLDAEQARKKRKEDLVRVYNIWQSGNQALVDGDRGGEDPFESLAKAGEDFLAKAGKWARERTRYSGRVGAIGDPFLVRMARATGVDEVEEAMEKGKGEDDLCDDMARYMKERWAEKLDKAGEVYDGLLTAVKWLEDKGWRAPVEVADLGSEGGGSDVEERRSASWVDLDEAFVSDADGHTGAEEEPVVTGNGGDGVGGGAGWNDHCGGDDDAGGESAPSPPELEAAEMRSYMEMVGGEPDESEWHDQRWVDGYGGSDGKPSFKALRWLGAHLTIQDQVIVAKEAGGRTRRGTQVSVIWRVGECAAPNEPTSAKFPDLPRVAVLEDVSSEDESMADSGDDEAEDELRDDSFVGGAVGEYSSVAPPCRLLTVHQDFGRGRVRLWR